MTCNLLGKLKFYVCIDKMRILLASIALLMRNFMTNLGIFSKCSKW